MRFVSPDGVYRGLAGAVPRLQELRLLQRYYHCRAQVMVIFPAVYHSVRVNVKQRGLPRGHGETGNGEHAIRPWTDRMWRTGVVCACHTGTCTVLCGDRVWSSR